MSLQRFFEKKFEKNRDFVKKIKKVCKKVWIEFRTLGTISHL
jgi:hypothetical protein